MTKQEFDENLKVLLAVLPDKGITLGREITTGNNKAVFAARYGDVPVKIEAHCPSDTTVLLLAWLLVKHSYDPLLELTAYAAKITHCEFNLVSVLRGEFEKG